MDPARPPGALARHGAVSLGAIAGTLLRHGQGAFLAAALPGSFPWGTFSINVAGTVALCAFLAALAETAGAHPLWRPFFAVGFCGGYTTFSSFELETLTLARKGETGVALGYVFASVALGLVAGFLGAAAVTAARRLHANLATVPPLLLAPVFAFVVSGGALLVTGRVAAGPDLALGCAAVALGGALGSMARYAGGGFVSFKLGSFFPWGTIIINVTGSFLIGLYDGVASRPAGLPPLARLFLVTGCLGGYTTFSTFAYETLALAREGSRGRAAANVTGSVLLGFAAAFAGRALGVFLVEGT